MDDPQRRRSGGRAARQALRLASHAEHVPFLTRKLAPFEVLGEEGLSLIEHNADTILEEVGIEFRGDPEALTLLHDAGADIDGVRVRFPRGMCRQIVQATAPRQFTQYARNPERNVEIGGMHTVFAPNYGSPFVRDLDNGRRYGTIEDFRNFVKLAYASPVPASLGRDGLRAGRRAGQQAPPRHGLFAHPLQRQAVHGLGHRPGTGARHGRDGAPHLRRRLPRGPHGDPVADQRQLAARLGLGDARRRARLRRGQPGDAPDAVHPGRRDGPGDRGRRLRPDPRRGARRDDLRPARPAGRAGRARLVRLARCRCSRARRRSARRSRRSCST